MPNEVIVSRRGYEQLKEELDRLKSVERQRISDAIREAKSHGDLRENAMYHEAKLNQKRLEGRIADLDRTLQVAKIVDRDDDSAHIAQLDSKVRVLDIKWDEELVFTLVGSFEADPARDMISITSPLGEALYGKEVGDEFEVEAPAGTMQYRVLSIE